MPNPYCGYAVVSPKLIPSMEVLISHFSTWDGVKRCHVPKRHGVKATERINLNAVF